MPKGMRYSDEFKRDAVSQVIDRGYNVQEVSDRLGITTKSLYGWRAKFARHVKPPLFVPILGSSFLGLVVSSPILDAVLYGCIL